MDALFDQGGVAGRLRSLAEAMRRAVLAGVTTIEHGDDGTPEVFRLMAEKGVALCPTVAAGDAVLRYRGWSPCVGPEPRSITAKRESLRAALAAGVPICFGGDVGLDVSVGPDRQAVVAELNFAFDAAIHIQVFGARQLSFDYH